MFKELADDKEPKVIVVDLEEAGLKDVMDQKDPQERLDYQADQEKMVHLVYQEKTEATEIQEMMVFQVFKEKWELLDPLVPVAHQDVLVCQGSQVHKEKLEIKENQVLVVNQVNQERKVHQGLKVLLELPVSQESQDKTATLEKMEYQVNQEFKDPKEIMDHEDSQAHQEPLVCQVSLEVPDKRERLALQVHQDLTVPKVPRDQMDKMEPLADVE